MMVAAFHKKWLVRVGVLIYLLFSFSIANASFWCMKMESISHLETGLIGKCRTESGATDFHHDDEHTGTAEICSAAKEECLDSPVYSSILAPSKRTEKSAKAFAASSSYDLLLVPKSDSDVAKFRNLNLLSRLPESQMLSGLRTVVLLH